MRIRSASVYALVGVLALGLGSAAARADGIADFYQGRDLKILVAFGAGGGYGLYARTLGQHIGRHIPGNPNVIMQFMPGAGGAKAANYLYNVAPRDGSMIAHLSNAAALAQVLQGDKLKYDAAEFNYLGRMVDMRSAIIIWHTAPVKTLEDAKTKTIVFGSDGKSGQNYLNPSLLKSVLGYKAKIVLGYSGAREINLAMERGEVHAMANSWGSVKARLGNWLKQDKIRVLAMVGLTRAPDLPNVPTMLELARDEQDRQVLELMAATTAIGRAFSTPPQVATERVQALRAAFKATMEDPAFQTDAKKRKMELSYESGETVQEIVLKTVRSSPQVIQRFREAIGLK